MARRRASAEAGSVTGLTSLHVQLERRNQIMGEIEMQTESDTTIPAPTHPGIRATLRALVGKLGTPDLMTGDVMGLAVLPPRGLEPALDWEGAPRDTRAEEEAARGAARAARAARARRRANAEAAYESVEGTHAAALDAALAVIEAEYAALERRCAAQSEALKQLIVYGCDAATRTLATRGLQGDAEILADHRVVDRGQIPTGTYHA